MKILQVTNKVPYPTKDGGAIACMNLTKGFAYLGHNVTVLSMNTEKHNISLDEIPDPIKDIAKFQLVDVPARISIFSALINFVFSRKPYNAVRFIDGGFGKTLEQLLTDNTFDIIQLEGLYVCPYIPLIRKNSNATIVYRSHNIEFEIWERTAKMSKGLKKIYLNNLSKRIKRFETNLLNSYDLLVPITERDGEILDRMGNRKKKHISQTGIDASVLVPNSKNLEHPSLFHIGSLEWAPNQEGLVWFVENCWPEIHEKYPTLRFYIAGRNAPAWLQHKFNAPNVVFEGEVADAYRFMNSKSIMIVPLFSGSGMRIKIIEGMALGKSIVTTPIGAEGIGISPNENIVIASDKEDFTDKISQLLEDNDFYIKIGKNAIEFIHENFDNLAAAGKLIEFYKVNAK
ncbi:glycosyltransferase family 4 protein [Prolixibacteraceae bacterium Z1-6]|uniref:Glycosyltransferase family 4 protein n=1 Tax=Draconibacterium aestuarii TaxID=2998507 RepID=A0A9X3F4A0_9BACT|nr:glycosyltransferase family 4 protein [Prolixibacteraceae bacterium Z1-6]